MDALRSYFDAVLKHLYTRQEIGILYRRLLQDLCDVSANDCYFCKDTDFNDMQIASMKAAADRLATNEPIEYILGQTRFLGLPIKLNPSVLIPRPETEELVDFALKKCKEKTNLRVMDLCCGSGCIAIALAKFADCNRVYALDISKAALETTAENAAINGVEVECVWADLLALGRAQCLSFPLFDVICCNPPYVRECEKVDMLPNVIDYEPHGALFVPDDDPLIFYRAAAEFCKLKLAVGGCAFFEMNRYLAYEIKGLFESYGFDCSVVFDMSSAPRILSVFRAF